MGTVPMVGRERELAALHDALDEACAGRGRAVLLGGEAGAGKTETVRALAAAAVSRAAMVLAGGCYASEWQPPYHPWLELLAPLDLIGDAGAAELSAPEARLRFFTSARDGLFRAAAAQPALVAVDDLHWAGADAIALFEFVARGVRDVPVLLVGTHREPDPALRGDRPLGALAAALVRDGGNLAIRLAPLDSTAVGALIARHLMEVLGGAPDGDRAGPAVVPGEIVRAIHSVTAGNPFYAREVARNLVEEGKLVQQAGRWSSDSSLGRLGIPESVRRVVQSRVARLEPVTQTFLTTAAVLPGNFGLATVRDAVPLAEEEALDAVDEALATGLLAPSGDRAAPYTFGHAIVRETLASALNPDRRTRLERRLAEVLDTTPDAAPGVVAQLYHASRVLPGAERGVAACLAAADEAAAHNSPGQAIGFLGLALDLVPPGAPALRMEILRRLAIAKADALDADGAVATTLDAVDGLGEDAAAALLVRVVRALREGTPRTAWERLVRHGLAVLGDRRDAAWARLVVMIDPTETVLDGPVYVGRWTGFPVAAVDALRATGEEADAALAIEPFAPRDETATEMLRRYARTWSEPVAQMRALDIAGRDLSLRHAKPVAAIACYEDLLALGERFGSIPAQAEACAQLALCHGLTGSIARAEELLGRAGTLVASLWPGHRLHLLGTVSSRTIVGYVVGEADWAGMAARITGAVRNPDARRAPWAVVFVALAALNHAFAGDAAESRVLLSAAAAALERLAPSDHAVAGTLHFAAAAAWELGDAEAAARLRPLLDAHERAGGPGGPLPTHDHAAGRLDVLVGEYAAARRRFAAARLPLERAGCGPIRALVDMDEATVPGAPAEQLTDAARAAFERLGMRGWLRRADAVREGGERRRADGLTPREVEVLALLSAGRTSKEIATALYVSLPTVNRHVANIYTKLDVRNRAEATAYAIRHDIRPA